MVGQPPQGFEFGFTAKVGTPGKWVVQAEEANKYLVQTDPDSTRARSAGRYVNLTDEELTEGDDRSVGAPGVS